MFFIMGVNQGRKNISHHQMIICDRCGQYGRYEVMMTYLYFSLFFLPIFKWKKRYFVKTSCCHSLYQLDARVGKAVAKGEEVEITLQDMTLIQKGTAARQETASHKFCIHCGYTTTEDDFAYCPKCGHPLEIGGSDYQSKR